VHFSQIFLNFTNFFKNRQDRLGPNFTFPPNFQTLLPNGGRGQRQPPEPFQYNPLVCMVSAQVQHAVLIRYSFRCLH
jgi:hypothetical protein